jgi:hypothetical protein
MGLFSNLMGKKLLGIVTINFYGENEASVEYKTEVLDKEQKESDLMQLFTLYYSKMLYNLNRGQHADQLIVYIQKAVESVMNKEGVAQVSILASGQRLVDPKICGVTKKYSGELYEKSNQTRIIQTHMDAVGEGYYAPVSTVMFLQYLIENFSEKPLIFLVLVLGGMNKYYKEVGDYSNMRSIIEAPNYGLNIATQILNSSK